MLFGSTNSFVKNIDKNSANIYSQHKHNAFFDFMVIITDKFSEGLNFSELETYTIHSRFKFFVGNKKSSVL